MENAGEKKQKSKTEKRTLTMAQLVQGITARDEKALKGLTEAQAARVVRATLKEVAGQLATAPDGVLKLQGLGEFVIASKARKDGEQSEPVRRVGFRATKERAKTPERAERKSKRKQAGEAKK